MIRLLSSLFSIFLLLSSVFSQTTPPKILIGLEIDTQTFSLAFFHDIIEWIQQEFPPPHSPPSLFACLYNTKSNSPLHSPELFTLLERNHIKYFFSSKTLLPTLCSFQHPALDRYDGLLQLSGASKPPSFPISTLPNLIVTSHLDHFYFNATFIARMRNFTLTLAPLPQSQSGSPPPPLLDRNLIATKMKQFISSREFLPSNTPTLSPVLPLTVSEVHSDGEVDSSPPPVTPSQSSRVSSPRPHPLPTRANPHRYHTSGLCNLWWPLNHTEIFIFAPSASSHSASAPSTYQHTESLIFTCPLLPSSPPYNNFNSQEEQFLLVLEQLSPSAPLPPRLGGGEGVEVGLMELVGKQFISQPFELKLIFLITPTERQKRIRLHLCPVYAPEVASLRPRGRGLSRLQAKRRDTVMKMSQSSTACFSSYDLILNILRPEDSLTSSTSPHTLSSVSTPPPLPYPHPHPMLNNIHSRDIFGHVLTMLGYSHGTTMVEIGVNRGHYSSLMLAQWAGENYLMIDPWVPQAMAEYVDVANLNSQDEHDEVFKEALRNTASHGSRAIILRNTSTNIARQMVESTVDVVYIDGLHHYQGVWDDMTAWWPILRPGGLMAGHDYMHEVDGAGTIFTVKPAVDEFARKMNLLVHQTKDSYPTWFLFKPIE
jgi:hypothetical protein